MHKRGGNRNNYHHNSNRFAGSSYSDDYDDRDKDRITSGTRRVSFKPSPTLHSRGMAIKARLAEMGIRARLEDDEEMGDFGGNGSGSGSGSKYRDGRHDNKGGRRKGSPIPKGKFVLMKKLITSSFGWYQVTIPFGQKYNKDDLIRHILTAIAPHIFIPQYWRTEKTCIVFYLDDFTLAEKLQSIDRLIQMPDGFRLAVKVRSGIPMVQVDSQFKERMKLVMAKRYNAQTKALDLSKFHADPDFKDFFCGLFRPPVMLAAIEIISTNIPDLEAINLNNNQIAQLESFRNVSSKIPNLKILYLGENRLQSVSSLSVFREVPIIELVLKPNPLRQRFKDTAQYVSEIRKKFPKLLRLDGEDLQPEIQFDVVSFSKLPPARASFLCDVSGAEIIRQFLEQYFTILDSDNRQPLLDAYHEQAMLTMSMPPASQAGRLNSFWKYNRSLLRTFNDPTSTQINRHRLTKVGRLSVVSMISEFPKTKHDLQSFSVDLTVFNPKMICFTVAGVFKEFGPGSSTSTNGDLRHFQRLFVIVPAGGGFCIRNELLFITSATILETKKAFKPPAVATTTTTVTSNNDLTSMQSRLDRLQVGSSSQPSQPLQQQPIAVVDDVTKLQMVQAMSAQSNMNLEWSKKCLEETNWDYSHAAFVFDKLHKENKIPPEAFIK